MDVSPLGLTDISDFSVYNDGSYTEIYNGNFAIGFNGDYTLTNTDFIFSISSGANTVTGTIGEDAPLNGTASDDVIEALAGNDVLLLTSVVDSGYTTDVDYIGDFVRGEDKIDVSALGFTGISDFSVYNDGSYTSEKI